MLKQTIENIKPLDQAAMTAARDHQNKLTKPAGSLGRLEEISIQLAGIFKKPTPRIKDKVIIIMAGDHGITAAGVSAYPQEVTPQMVLNFLNKGAAINSLAGHIEARILVVDMGVVIEFEPHIDLVSHKIAMGTQNMLEGPAMTLEQAESSVMIGIEVVTDEIEKGLDIVGTGDMGIGNTTPSAAIAAVLAGESPAKIAGRGTGVDNEGFARKISAIETAIKVNKPDPKDGLDILAKVGGFEIGGLVGVILGAAAHNRAVMLDGFISTAAAMIAVSIAPEAKSYLISAHRSQEQGHQLMLEWLGLDPLFDLNFRLGEGTGAALGISIAEAACKVLSEMATFTEAGVSEKEE